jgi:hypothetical protein
MVVRGESSVILPPSSLKGKMKNNISDKSIFVSFKAAIDH